jgi:hypothetical protein
VRRRWFGGFAAWGVAAAASASVNLGMPLNHPARAVHVTALTLGIVGAVSARPRLHTVIVALLCLISIAAALDPRLDPDWLTQP